MAGNSGVFIRCRHYERECLNALQQFLKPSEMYYVKKDDTYGGLKIFFSDSSIVRNILREQHLWISGKMFPIYSPTTTLIVHTEFFDFSGDFEEVLWNGMQHIGPILEISKPRLFNDVPNSYTGDWKIVLDVPEIEDLDVFYQIGSPNNMTLDLPGYKKKFRITFCCSFCDKDGHTLRSCPMIEDHDGNEYKPSSKYVPESGANRVTTPFDCRSDPCTSTSHYGGRLVVVESPRNASRKNVYHDDSMELPRSSNQDYAGQVAISSRPDGIIESAKSELPSRDDNVSDAAATGQQTPRGKKPARKSHINIPEGIKILIRQNPGVLDEERLVAFLNHVKKRSWPCEVARQYTEDIQGLKAQLQGIVNQYYNTPIIHSADEKYFMTWLERVLTRFDRTSI